MVGEDYASEEVKDLGGLVPLKWQVSYLCKSLALQLVGISFWFLPLSSSPAFLLFSQQLSLSHSIFHLLLLSHFLSLSCFLSPQRSALRAYHRSLSEPLQSKYHFLELSSSLACHL